MSYNTTEIQGIVNEAEHEIEAVMLKYQGRFVDAVQKQIPSNEYIRSGMGSAFRSKLYADNNPDENEFMALINEVVWGNGINIAFDLPYKMSANHRLTYDVEKVIDSNIENQKLPYPASIKAKYKAQTRFLKTGKY